MQNLPAVTQWWSRPRPGARLVPVFLGLGGAAMLAGATPAAEGPMPAPTVPSLVRSVTQPPPDHVARRRLYAAAPSVKSEGWLDVRTRMDRHGLHYEVLAEGGSERIRSKVLYPVLQAEQRALQPAEARSGALTPDNYTMTIEPAATGEYTVTLEPRRRDQKLVNGVAVLAPNGDLRRVEGKLARSPSFWVRSVAVIRHYARVGGVNVPVSVESLADVKMVGKARFAMVYEYESLAGRPVARQAAAPRLDVGPTARIETLLASAR